MTQAHSIATKNATLGALLALSLVVSLSIGSLMAQAAVTTQMSLGSTGADVTRLQTYLAANPELYPEGLITGYFGMLTQAAVQRFQSAQGIVSSGTPASTGYGRVGPMTMARLNQLMDGGVVTQTGSVPVLGATSVQFGRTTATVSWSTNELTKGQVFFDLEGVRADEATGPGQQPYISGTLVADNTMSTNHTVTLSGLQANTTYFYVVRAIDSDSNISITWPPASFRTAP
jgi:peptidoglycan hydrolase-like protein with peptidoglycan-binding domain